MAEFFIPDHIDWSAVRLLTIDLNTIRLLTDAGERVFRFQSEHELKMVLRAWTEPGNGASKNAELLARLVRGTAGPASQRKRSSALGAELPPDPVVTAAAGANHPAKERITIEPQRPVVRIGCVRSWQ